MHGGPAVRSFRFRRGAAAIGWLCAAIVLPGRAAPPEGGEGWGWHAPERLERVERIGLGGARRLPERFYEPADLAALRKRAAANPAALAGLRERADALEAIADDEYRGMIVPYSNFPSSDFWGLVCPFCGKSCVPFDSDRFDAFDLRAPFQSVRPCCGTLVYEREADYPPGYPYRRNGRILVTHMDGSEHAYPYWEGRDRLGNRARIYPRSHVWNTRLRHLRRVVIPTLADAYLQTGDERYARKARVLFHRLSEVYPDLPLWFRPIEPVDYRWLAGLGRIPEYGASPAISADGKSWLTRGEFDRWPRPAFDRQTVWQNYYRFAKPGRFGDELGALYGVAGILELPRAYLALRDPAPGAGGADEPPGDPQRIDREIRERFLGELVKEATSYCPAMGNYTGGSMRNAFYLGIAGQSAELYGLALDLADSILLNQAYPDGAFHEGSHLYQMMMSGYHESVAGMFAHRLPLRDEAFPFSRFARERMPRTLAAMTTFRGLPSAHGDGNDTVIGRFDNIAYDPDDRSTPLPSFLPSHGFAALRSGRPGRRTETMLLFDRNTGHTVGGNLYIQLAHEGNFVLSQLGYCYAEQRALDFTPGNPRYERLKALPYPDELVHALDKDEWTEGRSVWDLSHSGAMQNQVLVNERSAAAGWHMLRGMGQAITLAGPNRPGALNGALQVAEAEDPGSLRRAGGNTDIYRRALLQVERPDGGAYVVDLFRVRGGQRHLFQLKIPGGELLDHSLGEPRRLDPGRTAQDHLDTHPGVAEARTRSGCPYDSDAADTGFVYMRNLAVYADPPGAYRMRWRRDPQRFAPRSPETLRAMPRLATWAEHAPALIVDIHGLGEPRPAGPGQDRTAEEVWVSSADYPGTIVEVLDGSLERGVVVFRDAMSLYSKFRIGRTSLESRFLHLYEAYTEGEAPSVRRVSPLEFDPPKSFLEAVHHASVGLCAEFSDGSRDYIVSGDDMEWRSAGAGAGRTLRIGARFGLVRMTPGGEFAFGQVVSGTGFEAGGVRVSSAGDLTGELVDIVADITGTRRHSALIVRPHGSWPAGKALEGQPVHVGVSRNREDLYTIGRVTRRGALLRIDLEGVPPLGYHWDRVHRLSPHNPSQIEINPGSFGKGRNNKAFEGMRILFPAQGVELGVAEVARRVVGAGSLSQSLTVAQNVDLAALGIGEGSPFVIYGMAPGQTVRVPSNLAVRRDGPGVFTVQSNVDATLSEGGRSAVIRAEALAGGEGEVRWP